MLDLATAIQLVAGSGFAVGVLSVAIGSASLLFAPVRALLRGLWVLAKMASAGFPFLPALASLFRTAALALETGADALRGPAATTLEGVGALLAGAGQALPDIPTVTRETEPLWLRLDGNGERIEGFVPQPPGTPDVQIVTAVSIGAVAPTAVEDALVGSGESLAGTADRVVEAGDSLAATAEGLAEVADLLDGLS